ncbi:MAG: HNH endonuclease family protein [Sporichthyaceae bacterium]|nr:HNH endonuclease family protein [Sporichthyaceae bacterium]
MLRRDGEDVQTGSQCSPIQGRWRSQYDGKLVTDPGQIDIDHMVPLANAWRSGADEWTDGRREAFANDLVNPELLAVSQSSNRSKGDQAPDQWRPDNRTFWCTYARSWIAVKYEWHLSVTWTEKAALREMLGFC